MESSEAIKKLRNITGLKQDAFAEKLGTTQPFISGLENGKNGISFKTLNKYCKKLGIKGFEVKFIK